MMKRPPTGEAASATRLAHGPDADELTASAFARYAGVTPATITKEIQLGRLRARRVAGDGRGTFSIAHVDGEVWLANRRTRLLRRSRKPWNALQERLLAHCSATGGTLTKVASRIGCARGTLDAWLEHKDRALSERYIRALADELEISYEVALAEAGGETAEEKSKRTMREKVLPNAPQPGTPKFHAARRKGHAKLRNRPRSAETKARIAAGNRRAESGERGRRALDEWRARSGADVLQQVWKWLAWHPKPRRQDVRQYAQTVAVRLDRDVDDVLTVWEPYLKRLGAWSVGGAKRKDDERETLCSLAQAVLGESVEGIETERQLHAEVALLYWQSGGWRSGRFGVPAASGDPGSPDPRWRPVMIDRVRSLAGVEIHALWLQRS